MNKLSKIFVAALVATVATAPALAQADPQYTITDLGVVAPNTYSQTFGMSANGAYVVGRDLMADGQAGAWPAFIWNAGTGMVAQGNLAGRNYASAYAVTNNGLAVGVSTVTPSGSSPLPVVWTNGQATQLALPSGQTVGRAYGVNSSGIAVGSVGSGSGEIATIYNINTGTSSRITTLSAEGSYMQTAMDISSNGLVVGSGVDSSSRGVALVFDSVHNTMTQLTMPAYAGFNSSLAVDISDNGQFIVGSSGNGSQAFIWSATTGALLAPIPSVSSGGSLDSVNDQGWAVGTSGGLYSNPFLYADGQSYLISSIISNGAGWNFTTTTSASAAEISNNGLIVGTAKLNGIEHAYMLTPVPEPTTYALMMAGLMTLGFVARRRRSH